MANIKISELNPLLTVEDADVLPIVDNAVTKKVTAAILRSYTQGNSVLLTGNQTVAGIKTFTSQLASSVATGTAPFSVASTTKVTNLNADLLDGLSSADFQATLSGTGIVKSTSGTISYLTDNSTNWNTAFNDKINSAAVTGIGTNTLTLTQQDAGTITATWVNGTLIREIRNNTGATLTKGTIVYISGATGNKPTVSKAIATGDSTSAQTFGFVQEDILNNANGYVVIIGDLVGIDTSAFTEGDQLYLSATVAGAFTATKQYAPNHLVYVGIVTRSHPTLGQIEVNIQNGYELDELHNVAAQSPSNGDILQYVTSTGLWTKIGGTTSAISEGSNLYFTDARARAAISLTTTGTSGASTYNSTTGVLNVPNYGTALASYLPLAGGTLTGNLIGTTAQFNKIGIGNAAAGTSFIFSNVNPTGGTSISAWRGVFSASNDVTSRLNGVNIAVGTQASTTITDIVAYNAEGTSFGAGSSATRVTGFSVDSTLANALATNVFGFQSSIALGTNRWNLYMGGTAANYMNGQLLLGTTTTSAFKLDVVGTARLNGATTIGTDGVANTQNIWTGTSALRIGRNSTQYIDIIQDASSARMLATTAGKSFLIGTAEAQSLVLQTNNTTALTINSTQAATFVADATINGVKVGRGAGNIATNTAVGASALNANTTAIGNTAIGESALLSTTTGGLNTAIGSAALYTNISGINNTAVGRTALFSNTANGNVAVGFEAAYGNTSGTSITALGYRALKANTTGASNTAVGDSALTTNITGSSNVAIGLNALGVNIASNNTAVGFEAAYLQSNVGGTTAIGYQALRANTAGQNTALGFQSLSVNTTGSSNVSVGFQSLNTNTTGAVNVAIGNLALTANTTGSSNIAIGSQTDSGNFSGSVIIGRSAIATASNQFVIGSSGFPAGAVATEVNASSKVWNVIINGVAQKILLA